MAAAPPNRNKIGPAEFALAFELGVKCNEKALILNDAVAEMVTKLGMNPGSAYDYVANVGNLLNGRLYKRTLSNGAVRYFLEKIKNEYPKFVLNNAIASISQHVTYYEGVSGIKLKEISNICEEYFKYCNLKLDFRADDFEDQLIPASMSTKDLIGKSKEYPAIPSSSMITQLVFKRNPFARELVLRRANGSCEICLKSAPFVRKSDGTPYLEAHHKIPLSQFGEDLPENMLALCPNCHREQHFGLK